LKPAEANSSQDPIVKKKKEKPIAKKGWQSGSGCMPQVQTLVPQKNLKKGEPRSSSKAQDLILFLADKNNLVNSIHLPITTDSSPLSPCQPSPLSFTPGSIYLL
jgi:hypothetical protein